jgi:hypothetical protein
MRVSALLLTLSLPALPQGFRFGVKGGIPLTQYFETGSGGFPLRNFDAYSAATRRYAVGLTAEAWFGERFAIAGDVLYKRMGYVAEHRSFGGGRSDRSIYDAKGHSWDIPVLAKIRAAHGLFAAAGMTLRYLGPLRARGERVTQDLVAGIESRVGIDTTSPPELEDRFYAGLTAGGGVDLRAGRVSVVPEVRFTSWVSNLDSPLLRFRPRQVELLLGLVF